MTPGPTFPGAQAQPAGPCRRARAGRCCPASSRTRRPLPPARSPSQRGRASLPSRRSPSAQRGPARPTPRGQSGPGPARAGGSRTAPAGAGALRARAGPRGRRERAVTYPRGPAPPVGYIKGGAHAVGLFRSGFAAVAEEVRRVRRATLGQGQLTPKARRAPGWGVVGAEGKGRGREGWGAPAGTGVDGRTGRRAWGGGMAAHRPRRLPCAHPVVGGETGGAACPGGAEAEGAR